MGSEAYVVHPSPPSFLPRSALLALISAGLAPLVVACVDDDLTETPVSPVVETGLAADGDTLPWADEDPGEPDSIVHPTRGRIDLAISATGPLQPNAGVALSVQGVAREPIDSGEVVLTLPTKALMDHVGEGRPDLPVKARWVLPAMAAGDTWSGTYTVPGEAAGYYRAMANAYTHGPDGGPYLFDDVVRQAWMFVSEKDGRLTRWFEDTIFPEGVHPVAGPATADGAMYSRPDSNGLSWHRDSVYLHVVYTVSANDGFKPAVGARVYAHWETAPGVPGGGVGTRVVTVPEDGIVAFRCRPLFSRHMWGDVHAPNTDLVQGRDNIASWITNERHCGQLVQVEVKAHRYLPWRLLNLSADTLTKHFGHTRSRIKWNLNFDSTSGSSYNSFFDKITLRWASARRASFHWTVAHEYAHALHHKALGGMWRAGNCSPHWLERPSSVRCALQEGFADYAGTVGSGGFYKNCFEHFGDPGKPHPHPGGRRCRLEAASGLKPKIEGHVAALFLDLTDDREEKGDHTEYPGYYVARVFKTCETKSKYNMPWPLPDITKWWKRTNVSNIVWCLENYIDPAVHDTVFPDIRTPVDVKEKATEPLDWSRIDIRLTWLKNLK